MGAPETRKRQTLDHRHHHRSIASLISDEPSAPPSKKPKFLFPATPGTPPTTADHSPLAAAEPPRFQPVAPLPRFVHGPQRKSNFFGRGSSNSSRLGPAEPGGGFSVSSVSKNTRPNYGTPWQLGSNGLCRNRKVDKRPGDIGLEDYRNLVNSVQKEHIDVSLRKVEFSGLVSNESGVVLVADETKKVSELVAEDEKAGNVEMENVEMGLPLVEDGNGFIGKRPLHLDLLEQSSRRDSRIESLDLVLKSLEMKVWALRATSPSKAEKPEEDVNEAFLPLTVEDEDEINGALYGRRGEVLVAHEASNIVITREVMQCLSGSNWLNDEVINVYLELLKEREKRDPKKFLKCHFFNTFFFKKLTSGRSGYDFKSVRRWTTKRKLGYGLIECDKIFVPIHKDIHWCLAIIDVKERKFLYLDSLGGRDAEVLKVLARYFVDEVKDKGNKQIDTLSWKHEGVVGLPLQKNGWDCGMFMLKYTDFYSKGSSLCFNQDHMHYFRMRTVKEILRLRAE